MNIADCYRLLGLRTGAPYEEVKAAYRRLARQLHPDLNPGDQHAKDRFIRITEAYQFLLTVVSATGEAPTTDSAPSGDQSPSIKITRKESTPPKPDLSFADQNLLRSSYEQLQNFLKAKKFPRAIALVEGLARRFPNHPDVRQWQAIAYHQWGRQLIGDRDYDKARVYLKKALRTDPHNQRLWADVEQDFRRLEQSLYRRK